MSCRSRNSSKGGTWLSRRRRLDASAAMLPSSSTRTAHHHRVRYSILSLTITTTPTTCTLRATARCCVFFFFFFSRMIIRERSRATTGGSRKGSTVWNKSVAAGDAPSWADPLLRLHPSTNTGCIEGRLTSARPATGSVPCVLVYISRNGTHERDILSAEYYRYWYSSHCTGCQREARYCILHRDRTGASFMNSTDARRTPRKRSHY